jgi:hypothetical protein
MAYTKTETGLHAFNTRSGQIASRLRPAFILFDGVKTNEEVLSVAGKLGITESDINYLVQQGFLADSSGSEVRRAETEPTNSQSAIQPFAAQASPAQNPQASNRTPQERYRDAKPLATMVTAGLGFKGFRLNMAIEGASGYEELLALFPKIQAAAGPRACMALEWALKG